MCKYKQKYGEEKIGHCDIYKETGHSTGGLHCGSDIRNDI